MLAVSALFLSLAALAAAFQCGGYLLALLITQRLRQRQLIVQSMQQYNAAEQDFGAFEEELYVIEVEYGGIQGGQNSGGSTCTTECCRKGSGKRT